MLVNREGYRQRLAPQVPLRVFTKRGIRLRNSLRENLGKFHYSGVNRHEVWFKFYLTKENEVDMQTAYDWLLEQGYNVTTERTISSNMPMIRFRFKNEDMRTA
jgi:hypothetical protein